MLLPIHLTVAIPTYNGALRLPKVLEKLSNQVDTEAFSWEIVVIDNNSTDDTAKVVEKYQLSWQQPFTLRYAFESTQGAAFARTKAIEVARGSLVAFLDDDNLPAPDWVANAYKFSQSHPQAGAYGSKICGKFSAVPPSNFRKIACFFAIIDRGQTAHQYELDKKVLPPGAGLVVRKQVWQDYVPKCLFLNHTNKESGLASEDIEALIYIQRAGWEIWYNPEMQVEHEIPQSRFERDYVLALMRCVGLSRHHLRRLRWQSRHQLPLTLAYFLNDFRKLVIYWLKYRHILEKDMVAAGEFELLRCSLISPLFVYTKQYEKSGRSRQIQTFLLKSNSFSRVQ